MFEISWIILIVVSIIVDGIGIYTLIKDGHLEIKETIKYIRFEKEYKKLKKRIDK